jgi:hypothetical protein
MSDNAEAFVLPGFLPRKQFAKQLGVCERTIKRRVDAGQVVERPFGKERLVDIEATAARMRGDDKPKRRRAA